MTHQANTSDFEFENVFDDIYDKNSDYNNLIKILVSLLPELQIFIYSLSEKTFFGNPDLNTTVNNLNEKLIDKADNKEVFTTERAEKEFIFRYLSHDLNILIICIVPIDKASVNDLSLFAVLVKNTIEYGILIQKQNEIILEKEQIKRELETLKQLDLMLIEENYQQHLAAQAKEKEYSIKLENEIKKRTTELYDALEKANSMAMELTLANSNSDQLNKELAKQIVFSKEMAKKANDANIAKSQFLASMSHEIRTPMNGVVGMLGLILDTELTNEQRHFAETARSAAESLLVIINDILDFSKIEAGKLSLEIIGFNLNTLIDDFSAIMAPRAFEKKLEFICSIESDVPNSFKGDPGRIRQILVNLTGNAIKFTHKGEISIFVAIQEKKEKKVKLRFTVKDTGVGIPKEKHDALFKVFSQADSSITRKYGGTGLGLAISKQLVELMGGEIGFNSEPDKGSEFWFTAFLEKHLDNEQINKYDEKFKDSHILIVDDNNTNLEILANQLKSAGIRTEEAQDGLTAIKLLFDSIEKNDHFDAAILDMHMPVMDGETLCKAIKANEKLKYIPLMLLSSVGERGHSINYREVGFSEYLIKPASKVNLLNALSRMLGNKPLKEKEDKNLPKTNATDSNLLDSYRILLAEDNIVNQQVALGMLKKMGYKADVVANGFEVIKALEMILYDLVLMDINMPEMDGLEATKRIRSLNSTVRNPHVPVIALTAHAIDGFSEECYQSGMNGYLTKPINPKELKETLNKWLRLNTHNILTINEKKNAENSLLITTEHIDKLKIFDKKSFLERMMDDFDLAREIAADFIDDTDKRIEILKKAITNHDFENAERQAHTIKGASLNIEAKYLSEKAREIEDACEEKNIDFIISNIPELENRFFLFSMAIKDEILDFK